MSSPLHDFCADPTMRAAVKEAIGSVYEDTDYIRPDVGDVVADVLAVVRADIRERAEDQAGCGHVDDCSAKAIVLRRLADWLEA